MSSTPPGIVPPVGGVPAGWVRRADGSYADVTAGGGIVTSVTGTPPIASTGGATPDISIADFVGSGASHARGAVPDPGVSAGTTKFLREDATWDVPPNSGGTVTSIATTAPITGGTITGTGTIGVSDFVASGASHARGTVPDPGAAAGTTKFLREDATFAVPPGTGAYTQISIQTVTGSPATSITFSSIPATYTHLKLSVVGRSAGTVARSVAIQFNGDTNTNYCFQNMNATGTTLSASQGQTQSSIPVGTVGSATQNAAAFGYVEVDIPFYANTTFQKTSFSHGVDLRVANGAGELTLVGNNGARWKNTAAINSITVLVSPDGLIVGSIASLYGIT